MQSVDGKWILEGVEESDPGRIASAKELAEVVEELGFLPLFKNSIPGFSVEERTVAEHWFSGIPSVDPWSWREVIANDGQIAYGKLFSNRAGFISRSWYPYFAVMRRDGYDFDSRYEDGLASQKHKKLMDVFAHRDTIPSNELRVYGGFQKGGDKGFEGVVTALQMQTYLLVSGFERRRNKKNEEYGWTVASYATSEWLFGAEHVRSAYNIGAEEAKLHIINKLKKHFSEVTEAVANKLIR